MITDEARRAWYSEQAEYFGEWTEWCVAVASVEDEEAREYELARLAAHFGRLALQRPMKCSNCSWAGDISACGSDEVSEGIISTCPKCYSDCVEVKSHD